jgi:uncharacterized protein (DUF362 family)
MAAGGALSLSSPGSLINAFAQEGKGLAAPRPKPRKLFYEGGKPLLVVVEGNDVEKMLRKGLEALGGVDRLAKGKKVVFKASVVAPQPAPVSTPIDFMVGLGKLLTAAGSSAITLNDASAMTPEEGEEKFRTLKFIPTAGEAGFTAVNTVGMAPDNFLAVASRKWKHFKKIHVNKLLYGADVVVDCPVPKRHDKAIFTCALKTHFGSVYSPDRWKAHEEWDKGTAEGTTAFLETIPEFASAVNPELTVVDARTMLAKAGPVLIPGHSEVVKADKIVFCQDMVAVDAYCAKLLEEKDETFAAERILATLSYAEELGLGTSDLKKVVIKEVTA